MDLTQELNIYIIGRKGSGKNAFRYRLLSNSNKINAVESGFIPYNLKFNNTNKTQDFKKIFYHILEKVPPQRYISLSDFIRLKCNGIYIVYDITNKDSFVEALKWMDLFKEAKKNEMIGFSRGFIIPIMFLGNKIDIKNIEKIFSTEIENKIWENFGFFLYDEISCKENINIEKVKEVLIREIYEKNKNYIEGSIEEKEEEPKIEEKNIEQEKPKTTKKKKQKRRKNTSDCYDFCG